MQAAGGEEEAAYMARVLVNPAIYRWAVSRARIDPQTLDKRFPKFRLWEQQEAAPTLRQLEGFAAATHTPVGYFFLQGPPAEPLPIPDFRTIGDTPVQQPSADLIDTIQICQQRQEWYREFVRPATETGLTFVASIRPGSDALAAAREIGSTIGFDLDERAAFSSWEKALRRFVELVEEAGILIMISGIVMNNTHRKLDPEEFRGFTIIDDLAPLIFVNGSDSKSGQMFTLAHELAHVWAGQSALGNPQPREIDAQGHELWCNKVAAEMLVPTAAISEGFRPDAVLHAEVQRLARRFKVSTLVILRRIHDIGGLSREEFWSAYDTELERIKELDVRSGSGGDFHKNEALRVGRRFGSALVVSTLAGQTLYRDAFRLLGISKTETLLNFGKELGLPV